MSVSVILALLVGSGLALVLVGAITPYLIQERTTRMQTLQRLSDRRQVKKTQVSPAVILRKSDISRSWLHLFTDLRVPGVQRPIHIYISIIAITVTIGLLTTIKTQSWIGVTASLFLPTASWIVWARHRSIARKNEIDESIPEALDMIVRALRIGFPITMAIQGAARDLAGPLAEEFSLTADRVSYGQTLPSALQDLAVRCENQNLRFFAAAVSIQSSAGGNLADVLDRLCTVARGRIQMRRKINAITAEAKWSGRFLSAFPLLATAGLLAINPRFYEGVSNQEFFKPLMSIVGIMLLINVAFMRWLSKME